MQYVEITCKVSRPQEGNDIMIALLADMGCDSFTENTEGVLAYIPKQNFNPQALNDVAETARNFTFDIQLSYADMEDKDWNAEWESKYSPVLIDDVCYIRAPFHPAKENIKYEILIEPKMSFGTAHHATTAQILSYLLKEDCNGKNVLDMGTGTGVLAILAAQKGATYALAIDNDSWAYENCVENVQRNNMQHRVEVVLGDASAIKNAPYDIVIANINRNILLHDMHAYAQALKVNGILYLSGFYLHPDMDMLAEEALKYGIELQSYTVKNDWAAARLQKKR